MASQNGVGVTVTAQGEDDVPPGVVEHAEPGSLAVSLLACLDAIAELRSGDGLLDVDALSGAEGDEVFICCLFF